MKTLINTSRICRHRRCAAKLRAQRGFTLVEISIVLIVLGVVIAYIFSNVGGAEVDEVRTGGLNHHLDLVKKAAKAQRDITGCYPLHHTSFFLLEDGADGFVGSAGNNSCGYTNANDLQASFHPPYITNVTYDRDGIVLDSFLPSARGVITTLSANDPDASGGDTIVFYEIQGISSDFGESIFNKCVHPRTVTIAPEDSTRNLPCGISAGTAGVYIGAY